MVNKIITLICALFVSGVVHAQLEFDQKHLELGQVEWYGEGLGAVTVTNKSKKALMVTDVKTSSGLVTVDWNHSAIAPGAKTTLQIKYKGDLLGRFEKALYVYAEGQEKPYMLKVSGQVVIEKDSYQGEFPYKVGNIMLSTDNIEFDDVNRGEKPEAVIAVRNDGDAIYHPELMHLPPYLSQRAEPEKIRPGKTGKIIVTLDTKAVDGFGLKQSTVYVSRFPGDRVGKENEVEVSLVIIPPFDTTSVVQSALAPCLKMDQTELELPSIEGKSKVKGIIRLTNTGKSSLAIRALQVFNPAVNVDLTRMKIAPGATEKLKISVLSKYMNKSRGRLRVLMITNDPKQPKVIINVKLNKSK